MSIILKKISDAVWGLPTVALILSVGIILSFRTGFLQLRKLPSALRSPFRRKTAGKGISGFGSVCTALACTMGTGNIVGVAGAVAIGGPGAVFWMWVSAFFSMIIKYSEIFLCIKYREETRSGFSGGAAYYIKNGLPKRFFPLAVIFCLCGAAAAMGIGNLAQINAIGSCVLSTVRQICPGAAAYEQLIKFLTGLACASAAAVVLLGGIKKISAFCERAVPFMTVTYILMCLGVIFLNRRALADVIKSIFVGAFCPRAVTGGAVTGFFIGLKTGMCRGVFSNEAGLGSAPSAYRAAEGTPGELGLLGIFEVFCDTFVVCTLTAVTILCAGGLSFGSEGSFLTLSAFTSVYGSGAVFVFCPVLCTFAFTSIIGWGYYGEQFISFVCRGMRIPYLMFFCTLCTVGCLLKVDAAWLICEILNAIMILPNITALFLLRRDVS